MPVPPHAICGRQYRTRPRRTQASQMTMIGTRKTWLDSSSLLAMFAMSRHASKVRVNPTPASMSAPVIRHARLIPRVGLANATFKELAPGCDDRADDELPFADFRAGANDAAD